MVRLTSEGVCLGYVEWIGLVHVLPPFPRAEAFSELLKQFQQKLGKQCLYT